VIAGFRLVAEVMKRTAAPMVGGAVTPALLEVVVDPALYHVRKGRGLATAAPEDAV
jgi:Cu/Ag efflux pump CusA